ncbi:gluconate 2-dehydrogenase subunit 3 family protein [Algoriphagus persicinus]|uniref:gluconate 2-dehydrogenase subunit 3 family protein n=1 Tax=Algoriphagus persicinus TaxID=3108754 RepID=UPI002B38BA38|nr:MULTISPECIES: gluconate 2-dehydrogenase subunit 3 family protein [unclassified Algoriphagus]MEB2778817.1 gluconate 2-dehydrogenase subunit 3 family protein [Algoriphagus sp. C2-6-M1]MEB2783332.1 gluconate 2-dehydrogenase subunit 3 family protein [Algoriphagus sp. E1-3-M2]
MNRRIALRHLALISGGMALIPSCDFSSDDILAAYDNLKVTATQKQLLGAISDTIIPSGELKGALEVEVPDFILVMVNDCMKKEDQLQFTNGLAAFPAYAKNITGKKFDKLSTIEKEGLIQTGIDLQPAEAAAGEMDKAVSYFLNTTKRLTMQGYMASEYIQTEIIPYSLIPGPYNGAALISEIQKPRING